MATTRPTAASVRSDLLDEQAALDSIVSGLTDEQWALPTASPRWSVADQIGHLAFFDETAAWAIADEDRFRASLAGLGPALAPDATPDAVDDVTLGAYPGDGSRPNSCPRGGRTVSSWPMRPSTLADDTRVIWYGPSMGAKSFLTARLMECWAHGQHVVDAVGAEREATDRLRHIAQLGFITRTWTYVNRGLDAPTAEVRVELAAPSGGTWTFGPDDAEQSVVGDAVDFCLVVTQCRHVDTTDLVVTGDDARDWMTKAQAFAGSPTDGPAPT